MPYQKYQGPPIVVRYAFLTFILWQSLVLIETLFLIRLIKFCWQYNVLKWILRGNSNHGPVPVSSIFMKIKFLCFFRKDFKSMWGVYCKCKVGSKAESSSNMSLYCKLWFIKVCFQCIEIHQMSIQGQPMPFIWIYFFAGLQK